MTTSVRDRPLRPKAACAVSAESVRRWYLQAQIDRGDRRGATSEELAEIKELKAKARRLEDDNDILRRATVFFAGELDPRDR